MRHGHEIGITHSWNYCPDEEGIETCTHAVPGGNRFSVGITALMKKGLKR